MASAPEDPFDRAEGMRYVGRIARHALDHFIEGSDPACPRLGGLPRLGGDNPDYLYTSAPLSADYEYRLRGHRGEASFLALGTYSGDVGTEEGLKISGYLSESDLDFDDEGRFEIVISVEKKPGLWLPMQATTSQLMIRQSLLDRKRQRPAEFELERIGEEITPSALDPDRYAAQLDRAGRYVEGAIAQFLAWTDHYAARPNEIRLLEPALAAQAQGDPQTHYYLGYYDLEPDEVLQIDLVPPACEYWNLQLCNHWLESLDYENHAIHVNHHTAEYDEAGRVRMWVSDRDPGRPNWLDSAGHRRGCIVLRQVGTDHPDDPICRVMTFSGSQEAT